MERRFFGIHVRLLCLVAQCVSLSILSAACSREGVPVNTRVCEENSFEGQKAELDRILVELESEDFSDGWQRASKALDRWLAEYSSDYSLLIPVLADAELSSNAMKWIPAKLRAEGHGEAQRVLREVFKMGSEERKLELVTHIGLLDNAEFQTVQLLADFAGFESELGRRAMLGFGSAAQGLRKTGEHKVFWEKLRANFEATESMSEKRYVIAAMGNMGAVEQVEFIKPHLANPELKSDAIQSLRFVESTEARLILQELGRTEADERDRERAIFSMGFVEPRKEEFEYFVERMENEKDPRVHRVVLARMERLATVDERAKEYLKKRGEGTN